MSKLIIAILLLASTAAKAADEYEVEMAYDDEYFIINGEKYEAQTYCFNVEEGDTVIFIEGSPYGACASAKFFNTRTKEICNVWCE